MKNDMDNLESKIAKAQKAKENVLNAAKVFRDEVLVAMNELRKVVDTLETKVDEEYWPMPNYIDLLYGI